MNEQTVSAERVPLPAIMTNPSLLADGDPWAHRCSSCGAVTQGGTPGLHSHQGVVHGYTGYTDAGLRSWTWSGV